MKKLLVFTFIFLMAATSAYAQQTLPSEIKEVTLFLDQALVKREAKTQAKEGLNELSIELDAFYVDRDSVSAKVFGEGEVFSVQFKEVYLKDAPQENVRLLEEKLETLKDSKRLLSDQKEVLAKKDKFLNSLIDFSGTQVPQDIKTAFPKTEDLAKTLQFLGTSLGEINKEREGLDIKIRDTDEEIEVVEKELASLRRRGQDVRKVIEILFNSKKDQPVRIEASYLTPNATWGTLYKVDVPLSLDDINLIMFSKIMQKTGEDWRNIKLAISNVIPLKGVGLPPLDSWFLDVNRPQAARRDTFGNVMLKSASMEVREEAGFAPKDEELADFVYAEKKELPLSFEYALPQALSIESKDKETILPLFSKDIKGEFFHYAVPKVSPLTFLVCKATADKELLSGYLNVYFGGRFIGKTFLNEKKAGEDFNLSLGADREVKIKKEKLKDKIEETFFGKIERQTIIREMAFKTTVENLKDKPVKIKILDNIPVSSTDKVEVKDVKIKPEASEKDYQDKKGVMLWEFNIKPGDKKEIDIEFVLTYPKDAIIYGL